MGKTKIDQKLVYNPTFFLHFNLFIFILIFSRDNHKLTSSPLPRDAIIMTFLVSMLLPQTLGFVYLLLLLLLLGVCIFWFSFRLVMFLIFLIQNMMMLIVRWNVIIKSRGQKEEEGEPYIYNL